MLLRKLVEFAKQRMICKNINDTGQMVGFYIYEERLANATIMEKGKTMIRN